MIQLKMSNLNCLIMKKIVFFISLLAVSLSAFPQNQDDINKSGNKSGIRTLTDYDRGLGGYGAFSMQYSSINDRDAYIFSCKGGLLLGHSFTLGLAGTGFINDPYYDSGLDADVSLVGGYGGLLIEPVIMYRSPVNIAFPLMIGAGGVSLVNMYDNYWDNWDNWDDYYDLGRSDVFLVIEPGIEVQLNVTRFFRFCAGGYYRYTSAIEIEDQVGPMPSDMLRGFSVGVTFKFGKF